MARLTNALRNEIVNSLVSTTLKLRGEVLEREVKIVAFKARDEYLGEFKGQYLSLPGYLQEEASYMNVSLDRLGERNDHFYFQFHPRVELIPYYGEDCGRFRTGS